MIGSRLPAAYIHVPFCRHRCGYCNFTLVANRDELVDDYLRAVDRELHDLESPRDVSTIYVGGGTPTHLSTDQLSRLMEIIHEWFQIAPHAEFSIEANPSDICDEKVRVLADAGVNRVSIGSQSFNAKKLRELERDHDADTIQQCTETIRKRIQNVSLDLIFAAPNETVQEWEGDLDAAIALQPKHVSTYGLTIERGTKFWSRQLHEKLHEVDDETQRSMYEMAIDKLEDRGFRHYEVSNFAQDGYRSEHNECYWLGGEYYAVGPGAARYLNGVRSMNHRSTTTYIKRVLAGESPIAESEQLTREDIARERLVFGLRRMEGIDCASFEREVGYAIDELAGKCLTDFIDAGLFLRSEGRLRLTRDGLMISDSIWPSFLVP
ncbi:radical SAM family heme chaperone HemW [Planctomycetota bacterium]